MPIRPLHPCSRVGGRAGCEVAFAAYAGCDWPGNRSTIVAARRLAHISASTFRMGNGQQHDPVGASHRKAPVHTPRDPYPLGLGRSASLSENEQRIGSIDETKSHRPNVGYPPHGFNASFHRDVLSVKAEWIGRDLAQIGREEPAASQRQRDGEGEHHDWETGPHGDGSYEATGLASSSRDGTGRDRTGRL